MTILPPLLDKRRGIALFTDGSANYKDQSGGWAFIAIDAFTGMYTAASYRSRSTIGQMELVAPTKGLDWLASHLGRCEVLVYCDAQYVVLGATDRTRKRNKNKKLWTELDRAVARHDYVKWNHVKGHSGHKYNEMADELARMARKSRGQITA